MIDVEKTKKVSKDLAEFFKKHKDSYKVILGEIGEMALMKGDAQNERND